MAKNTVVFEDLNYQELRRRANPQVPGRVLEGTLKALEAGLFSGGPASALALAPQLSGGARRFR
jgi:hypothetical protein